MVHFPSVAPCEFSLGNLPKRDDFKFPFRSALRLPSAKKSRRGNSITRSVYEYFVRSIDTPNDTRRIRYASFLCSRIKTEHSLFLRLLLLFSTRIIIVLRSCLPSPFLSSHQRRFQRGELLILLVRQVAGAAKRKEPEIVAQMNLKYCRSTSLSPVSDRSVLFPTFHYLSFVLLLALYAWNGTAPGTIPFLLSIPPFAMSFLQVSSSPCLSLCLSEATSWIDAPSRISSSATV